MDERISGQVRWMMGKVVEVSRRRGRGQGRWMIDRGTVVGG